MVNENINQTLTNKTLPVTFLAPLLSCICQSIQSLTKQRFYIK